MSSIVQLFQTLEKKYSNKNLQVKYAIVGNNFKNVYFLLLISHKSYRFYFYDYYVVSSHSTVRSRT